MAPLNSHYSQTDYARAVLRMAIKSANITTDEIISRHLYRAAFVPDGYGSYTIDSSLVDNIKYNPFNATKKTLNDAFFNSTMNTAPGSVIAQAYTMLGISGDPIEAARIDLEYNENALNISNIIKHILVDFHNSKNTRAKQIATSIYEGKTPKAEGLEKIKQIDKEKIVGENYHDHRIQKNTPFFRNPEFDAQGVTGTRRLSLWWFLAQQLLSLVGVCCIFDLWIDRV